GARARGTPLRAHARRGAPRELRATPTDGRARPTRAPHPRLATRATRPTLRPGASTPRLPESLAASLTKTPSLSRPAPNLQTHPRPRLLHFPLLPFAFCLLPSTPRP